MKTKNKKGKKNFIDLFAGCGGLSLGLEQSGFNPLLVCELSPDAMKTYMANRPELTIKKEFDITKLKNPRINKYLDEWGCDITFSQVGMPTILIKGTKNESRLRRIPIQPNLQHLILPWMDIIKSKSKEYFFPDGLMEDGEINKNKWRYHFDKISKNKNLLIGQRYLQWPKLINRHTYASMRVANGVPLNVVKEEMGHEYKSMTTLKHYIDHHLDIDDGTTFWNIGLENPSRRNNVVGH